MDGHGGSTTTSVVELRMRLYRPMPPSGAVAAYLEALRAAPPPTAMPVPARPPRRRQHRRAVAALASALCAAGAVAAAVLLGRQVPAVLDPAVHEEPAATGSPGAGRLAAPPLTGVPLGDLFGDGRSSSGRFSANGHRVVASVLCTGSGTIALTIGAEPPTVLTCETGTPALAMIASTGPLDRFTITVTPDGPIRWSLAAGALTG